MQTSPFNQNLQSIQICQIEIFKKKLNILFTFLSFAFVFLGLGIYILFIDTNPSSNLFIWAIIISGIGFLSSGLYGILYNVKAPSIFFIKTAKTPL
jgi:hypothetical protein